MVAIVLAAALLAAYILLRRNEDSEWVVMHESPGHRPDATTRIHTELRSRGVRCKLKVRGTGLGGQGRTGFGTGALGQSYQLLVHEDDVEDAEPIVARFADHRSTSPL